MPVDNDRLSRQLAFLREIDKVKQIYRNTVLMDASRRENDAEHSWHAAMCAMLLSEYADKPGADINRVIRILLLHDVVEIDAGDTFAYDEEGKKTQKQRENAAADRIFALLPEDQRIDFRTLWDEFEADETPEAHLSHAFDTFMPLYHNYATRGKKWRELGVTKPMVLHKASSLRCGSEALWEYAVSLIEVAADKGWLAEG